jgi:hypothetical protein
MASNKFRAPAYSAERPDMFFAALESQFRIHKITEEKHQYSLLINAVNFSDMGEKASTHIIKEPDATPYSVLKAAILETIKPADYNQVRAIMQKEKLGDLKPTEFLAKLFRHADPDGLKNEMVVADVKDTWLRAMPPEWCNALLTINDLQEAAKVADNLKYWRENPVTQAIYQAATGGAAAPAPVAATIPVAAVASSGGFPGVPQVAAAAAMSDSTRLDRLEDMVTKLGMLLMQQNSGGGGRNNNNNNNDNGQQHNSRSNDRGRNSTWRGRGRSQSPARINNGLCYYHGKFADKARRCDSGCLHYNQFMAEKGSAGKASNFQGR